MAQNQLIVEAIEIAHYWVKPLKWLNIAGNLSATHDLSRGLDAPIKRIAKLHIRHKSPLEYMRRLL